MFSMQQERSSMFRGMYSCSMEMSSQMETTFADQKRKKDLHMSRMLVEVK